MYRKNSNRDEQHQYSNWKWPGQWRDVKCQSLNVPRMKWRHQQQEGASKDKTEQERNYSIGKWWFQTTVTGVFLQDFAEPRLVRRLELKMNFTRKSCPELPSTSSNRYYTLKQCPLQTTITSYIFDSFHFYDSLQCLVKSVTSLGKVVNFKLCNDVLRDYHQQPGCEIKN